jgi:hypothetical protein
MGKLNDFSQLTFYPVSVGHVKYHAAGSFLTFTATVNADGEIENGRKKETFYSGVVYGNSFFRSR